MALFAFDPSVVPDIDFAQKDASIVQSQVVSDHERMFYLITRINKTLGRADPVRLFLLGVVYQLVVQRNIVDFTGKSNLIKYSRGDYLDNIGARWGPTRGRRLPAQKASCTLRFSLAAALAIDVIVPYATRAQTNEGIEFSTTSEGRIPSGALFCDVPAVAVEAGEAANDLAPGQISNIVTPNLPYLTGVTNITESSGGADRENDERFRARIWMAPESFSVAGPYGAYEYWAASANPNISDVSIWSDADHAGQVYIYFIMEGGRLPTEVEKQQVYDICSADDIRPLTDQVFVESPAVIDFPVIATFWIDWNKATFAASIRDGVYTAFEHYKLWQKTEIGRDINMSVMIQMLINAGASRVGLISPGLDDPENKIDARKIAIPDGSTLTYGGLERRDPAMPTRSLIKR